MLRPFVLLCAAGAPAEAVAGHLLHTEPSGDAAACAVLMEAGRRALAAGAPAEAAASLARALAEPPPAEERPRLLLDLARAEHGTGASALDRIAEAFATPPRPDHPGRRRARLVWSGGPGEQGPRRRWRCSRRRWRGRRARPRARAAARVRAHERRVHGPELMRQIVGSAERFADLPGGRKGSASSCCTSRCTGSSAAAPPRTWSSRSSASAASPAVARRRWARTPSTSRSSSASSTRRTGSTQAAELVDWQLAESARAGSVPGFVLGSALARVDRGCAQGDAAAAEADARAAYDLVADVLWHRHFAAAGLVDVLVDRGAYDEARARAPRRHARGRDAPGRRFRAPALHPLASAAATGDAQGALEDQVGSRRAYGDFTGARSELLRLAAPRPRMLHATGEGGGCGARQRRGARVRARSGARPATSARRSSSPASSAAARRAWRCCARPSPSSSARPRGASWCSR